MGLVIARGRWKQGLGAGHSGGGGDGDICNSINSKYKVKKRPWLVWLSGWSAAFEPKGQWLDSQSGHMPGLWARSPAGVSERQPHIDISLLLFL